MTANSTASRKAKSRALQNFCADELKAYFPPLGSNDIRPAIMGTAGIDILLSTRARESFPYGIECKNQESFNVWESLKQCEANAEKEKLIPLLVFKRNHTETYVCLRWQDFIGLVKK